MNNLQIISDKNKKSQTIKKIFLKKLTKSVRKIQTSNCIGVIKWRP